MAEAQHFTPETLDEAAALLLAADRQARPRARGTDLVSQATAAQRSVPIVLDLRRIPEFNRLDYDERNGLRMGAAVPIPTILAFPPVRQVYPMLGDGFAWPGSAPNQDCATLGDKLGEILPSAGTALPLICLRATAAVFGPHGWSEMALEIVFAEPGRTGLQVGEFVVDVRLPAPPPRSNGAFLRFHPPDAIGVAPGGVAAFLVMEKDLVTCCGARLALSDVRPAPVRAPEGERLLAGKRLDDSVMQQAGEVVARALLPDSGSCHAADDRFSQVKLATHRALLKALERVRAAALA
jgi:carbon-monoxide dehydrogenase medium subunit